MTKQEFIDAWFNCGILVEKYRKVMDTDLNLIIKFYTSQDKGVCKWKMDSEQYGYPNCYDRGQTFLTTDAKYCPFCGLKIERV